MNAVIAIHEQYAANKQRLSIARDEAAARLSAHERATEVKASQFAEMEGVYVANAASKALGLDRAQDLPDANVLEKLRADVAIGEPVRRLLAANLERCEGELKAAQGKHKAAVCDYLREVAVPPALDEFHTAFEGLRDAAVNLMAAHYLAYRKFDDRAPMLNNAQEAYGPASEWLFDLNRATWPTYPDKIRPAWLPENGRFYPDELPGVAERVAELLVEVEQVAA